MANRRCSFIKAGGERCKRIATDGSEYCYSHRPDRSAERSRNASKGGRTGGNGRPGDGPGAGDVAQVRKEIRGVIGGVFKGTIHRSTGGVLFQGFNTLLRGFETERRIREQDDILERLEALEAMELETGGRSSWRR